MNYTLPKSVYVGGAEYAIRSDFRAALDICAALNDADLDDQERAITVLSIFYPSSEDMSEKELAEAAGKRFFEEMPQEDYKEAIEKCFWFLRCGEEERSKGQPQLVSWEQDFNIICPPVNRIIGKDIRGMDYLHFWSFRSAYMEIGDCFFAQVVAIRSKKASGKQLDKQDRAFYRKNRDIIDIKVKYTEAEQNLLKEWM